MYKMTYVKDLRQRPIAQNQQDANQQHYEVPPTFYDYCLGDWKKYSCGIWPEECTSLTESEEHGLRLVCDRAQLHMLPKVSSGPHRPQLLDLGCGWGSVSLFVATHYPHIDILSVSNSRSQKDYIEAEAEQRGLHNIRVVTADAAVFQPEETFDRIISVEMFEHIKNYERLLERISRWLKNWTWILPWQPRGKLFVHHFSHASMPYHFEKGWMAETFFTGGQMPSDDLLLHFQRHLRVTDHWVVDGRHYEKTSNAWLAKMDRHKQDILRVFASAPDPNHEFMKWRLFYLAVAENFGYNRGQEYFVSHYLFEPHQESYRNIAARHR